MTANEFHAPVRPFSPIDALNRRAAALGSPSYAQLAGHANYNGHHVSVTWNSYRQYYVAEYTWAGRVVIARGSFEACLNAALREYEKGALGASVGVRLREDDEVASALCVERGLVAGQCSFGHQESWYTWKHEAAAEAARDSANPRLSVRLFDWTLLQAANTIDEYESAVQAKHGRVWV